MKDLSNKIRPPLRSEARRGRGRRRALGLCGLNWELNNELEFGVFVQQEQALESGLHTSSTIPLTILP